MPALMVDAEDWNSRPASPLAGSLRLGLLGAGISGQSYHSLEQQFSTCGSHPLCAAYQIFTLQFITVANENNFMAGVTLGKLRNTGLERLHLPVQKTEVPEPRQSCVLRPPLGLSVGLAWLCVILGQCLPALQPWKSGGL